MTDDRENLNGEIKNYCGKRIREIRKSKKMSQKDLADRITSKGLKMTRLTVLRIENQIRPVTDIELVMFALVLEIPIYSLVYDNYAITKSNFGMEVAEKGPSYNNSKKHE